ncbi:CoA-binding protein [Aquaticitalea lipolytica]|jgi:predicted CoA-binding protein|nr:CoA-binding protein [Aquaticitalea lipolytica]
MKKTLVMGASLNPSRYSNLAIVRLVDASHKVVAFGLKEGEVNGVNIDTELEQYDNINTVTMYLSAQHQKEYYAYIMSLNPKRVIFNPGTENPEFYKLLSEKSIQFEESCTLVLLSTNQY